jgi:hypothetical protein
MALPLKSHPYGREKNRPDVTSSDEVFGVRQRSSAFETKAAAALPHSKCSVEIVTVLPVLQQIKDDFFSDPAGRSLGSIKP